MKVGHLVAEISADKQTNRQTDKPRSEIIYVDLILGGLTRADGAKSRPFQTE